jgi:hypothetical protein
MRITHIGLRISAAVAVIRGASTRSIPVTSTMRIALKTLVGTLLVALVVSWGWQVFVIDHDRKMESPLDEKRPGYRQTVETPPQ